MPRYHIDARVPGWLVPIIQRYGETVFAIDDDIEQEIEDLIEREKYQKARRIIDRLDSMYGGNTTVGIFTTRLSTRISRIEILADEKSLL